MQIFNFYNYNTLHSAHTLQHVVDSHNYEGDLLKSMDKICSGECVHFQGKQVYHFQFAILLNKGYPIKCLSIGTPKSLIFHFFQMENSWLLRVPIFKHIIMRLYSA